MKFFKLLFLFVALSSTVLLTTGCEEDATCIDGVKNGDETGIDCGGTCDACFTCTDGVMNGDETGIDCGGSCDACTEALEIFWFKYSSFVSW